MENIRKIGRYEILEELGHGAMGTVYRAKDPAMDRIVALKTIISVVLANDQGGEFRERFYREARAAGALAHPGIVPVFDVGEHEGLPFLVMEFVKGKTLSDTVKGGQRLTLDRVCEVGQRVAEALGYAHQHGVVHRDIKPANILITSRETYGIERPKITDFGVAKMAEGNTTLTGQMLGTPAFMPPEQFTGSAVDGRADIFSLGVILYWMTTGEQPFPGESMTAVSYKVVHTEPVPPRKLNPSIPAKLENVILKCLAKSPEDRYQSGEQLARELGDLRAGNTMAAAVKTTVAPLPAADCDPDATLIEHPATAGATHDLLMATTQRSARPAIASPNPMSGPEGSSRSPLPLIAAGVAIIALVSWFALRKREKPPIQVVAAPAAAVSVTAPAVQAPAPAPVAKPVAEPAVAKTVVPAITTVPAKAPTREAAPVDFDPRNLDAKTNSKLKIEADRMPEGLAFVVEMNGKVYLRGSVSGKKTQIDNLYVPPGVQEFRVRAGDGTLQKFSNIVSTEFKPKKKHTLKIELRTQGTSPEGGVPQGLYPNSQVVVALQ